MKKRVTVRRTYKTGGIIVALALLLAGCTAVRKSKSVDESKTVDRTQNDITQMSAGYALLSGRSLFEQLDQMQDRRIVRGVLYDTSRPIDSATGKPPVLYEFTIEDTASRKTETVRRDTASEVRADTAVRVDRTKSDVQEVRKTEVKETTKKRVPGWVWLAGVGVLLFFIIRTRMFK